MSANCPDCKTEMEQMAPENCSCHINPPCSACTDAPMFCVKCGYKEEIKFMNDFRYVVKNDDIRSITDYRPRTLDKTKIDWHSKSHTHASMIKEGIYPNGTSQSDVEKLVEGTFGGRFEHFGNGKFKYIAYTD